MSRRSFVLFAGALLALLLAGLLRWDSSSSPDTTGRDSGADVRTEGRNRPEVPIDDVAEVGAGDPSRAVVPDVTHLQARSVESPESGAAGAAGLTLRGRVLDDLGAPVFVFSLLLHPIGWEKLAANDVSARVVRSFETQDGVFALEGLRAGSWTARAESAGLTSPWLEIELSVDSSAIAFVVPRSACLTGTVVDPEDRPVAGAEIIVQVDRQVSGRLTTQMHRRTSTDANGRYALTGLAPGSVWLQAGGPNLSASERVMYELAPGQTSDSSRLRLRTGGRIVGEVIDWRGGPEVGRKVTLHGPPVPGRGPPIAEADSSGHFEFEHLPDGKYLLMRVLGTDEAGDVADPAEKTRVLMHVRAMLEIDITNEETLQVVLGGKIDQGLRMWGIVSGAEGCGAAVFVNAWSDPPRQGVSRFFGLVGEQGRYEVALSWPGEYRVTVNSRVGELSSQRITVPPDASFHLDIALATGTIRGRVLAPDGTPLAAMTVAVTPDAISEVAPGIEASKRQVRQSDDAGAFLFSGLRAGSYALTADVRNGIEDVRTWATSARVFGLILENGGSIDGVELRFGMAASIEVFASGPDGPLAASLQVRDEHGNDLGYVSPGETDARGHARIQGLAPGRWFVRARTDDLVSDWTGPIELVEKGSARVRLALFPGSHVRPRTTDATGHPVEARVRAVDERGMEIGVASTRVRKDGEAPAGIDRGETLGPLPRGRITLLASDSKGRHARAEVLLAGEPEVSVDLELVE